jgi:hypothetical protein
VTCLRFLDLYKGIQINATNSWNSCGRHKVKNFV